MARPTGDQLTDASHCDVPCYPGRGCTEPADLTLARLGELIEPVSAAGIQLETKINIDPRTLPRDVDEVGYRVVQEALTNIVRHSGARHGSISISQVDGHLVIMIDDDGNGPTDQHAPPGQGLVGMAERVRALAGTVQIGSVDQRGFTVTADIPLKGAS